MARRTIEQTVDDLDGSMIEEGQGETIEFAYRGKSYSIDLSAQNAAEFDQVMAKYISAVAPKRPSRGTVRNLSRSGGGRSSSEDGQAIRAWARENGFEVSERGRIPQEIVEAFRAAH